MYKVAAASLVVFSAHSTAFKLKETSYNFLLDIALATLILATVKCDKRLAVAKEHESVDREAFCVDCGEPGHYSGPGLY